MKRIIGLLCLISLPFAGLAQVDSTDTSYWNTDLQINSYRLPPPPAGAKIEYIDLDNDGDPDVLRTVTLRGMAVQWIDDDDNMQYGDREGDTVNDCLMIDRSGTGKYDLIVDWIDTDQDGKADMQVVVDIPASGVGGHYMWVIDTDQDNIFNYIDWNKMALRCWIHDGASDFFEDYHGKSLFLKAHASPDRINDPRLNWENPFLFFDPDHDKLTEMAIRVLDVPEKLDTDSGQLWNLSGNITYASIAIDLDNDNGPGNEFDFDMTIGFTGGKGFNYLDQVHRFNNMRGLPEADSFFVDPRWRQMSELIYPDHDAVWNLIFNRGQWEQARLVYDEDDDCERWERVEFYEPGELFKIGERKLGVDNHRQSDAAGDRGEWDTDNSGKGNLYVSKFDGRIHLYGAETGVWRIDQNAWSYQGMGGIYDGYGVGRTQKEPAIFATVRYTDTDKNGFFDLIEYDLDGDTVFEKRVSLHELGIDDRCEIIETASMNYADFTTLQQKVSDRMWKNAQEALSITRKEGINTNWYALLMSPKSIRQKYHHGYWLQFYLFNDLVDLYQKKRDSQRMKEVCKSYYSGKWRK